MRSPQVWLITDTHWNADFGKWRPPNYGHLITKNCRKLMARQDILIHLGDVINNRPGELSMYMAQIPGATKILIRGNHDDAKDGWYLGKGFNLVCEQLVMGDILLSHKPQAVLPQGVRINIHGHFHDNPLEKCFRHEPELAAIYNPLIHKLLALEHVDYRPVRLEEYGNSAPIGAVPAEQPQADDGGCSEKTA